MIYFIIGVIVGILILGIVVAYCCAEAISAFMTMFWNRF